ncbi:MAG: hypothetical protein JW940_32185 [Polyangiaceae bacterium]|nr:hypothetical protein [Polyangiaceae bacterium]
MSRRLAWQWPSFGFGILVASYGLLAAVLTWGFTTPELDRAWRVIQRTREPDFTGLRRSELQTLSAALQRHPGLAGALAQRSPVGFLEPSPDDCTAMPLSHLLVQPAPADSLRIDVAAHGDSSAFPLTVSLRGGGIDRTLRFEHPVQSSFVLSPGHPRVPILLTVTLATADATPPRRSVRVCIAGQAFASGEASP